MSLSCSDFEWVIAKKVTFGGFAETRFFRKEGVTNHPWDLFFSNNFLGSILLFDPKFSILKSSFFISTSSSLAPKLFFKIIISKNWKMSWNVFVRTKLAKPNCLSAQIPILMDWMATCWKSIQHNRVLLGSIWKKELCSKISLIPFLRCSPGTLAQLSHEWS